MTVYFIGAGPGAPDLITVRGLNIVKTAPVCLYAGSLVPEGIVAQADKAVVVKDTAPMHLDEIIAEIEEAHNNGHDVARVHSGDPCLYGAIAEQMRRLDALGIDYEVVPGVSAYAAASAALKKELTLPDVSQSIILTRTAVRSSKMPNNEDLETFAKSGATLAIHLSVNNLKHVVDTLSPYYGEDCPVVVAYRVSWPDEAFIHGQLNDIRAKVKESGITRTALILVGKVLATEDFTDSKLYDVDHTHVLREKKKA
ncbi:precorrin-4 C(11)-methyltransferase [Terasakiella pusilla]|uniref:precorrin-4 C(11)-methyltransferase n=1 Tax=Terasakiella pusilla TaxID=64973 RepID=UPI00048D6769|nr:precorrin-4 C(11)-methyltransferase [Terasakiella pusilla]